MRYQTTFSGPLSDVNAAIFHVRGEGGQFGFIDIADPSAHTQQDPKGHVMKLISKITRPVTAMALAASVALSPVAATEARAGSEEALIAGAIGTIILGAIATQAIGNGNIRFHSNTQSHYQPRNPAPTYGNTHGGRHDGNRGGHHDNRGNHGGNRHNAKQLPSSCIVNNIPGERGVLFGNRCLQRNFAGASRLPAQCKDHVYNRNTGNVRNVYRGHCLRQYGYTIAAR